MATEKIKAIGVQDTGNPVLDSMVNLLSSGCVSSNVTFEQLHEILLNLAEKEPGGLRHYAAYECVPNRTSKIG